MLLFLLVVYSTSAYASHDNIKAVEYTGDSFDDALKNNNFVMFYAPWCGHCSRLAPVWEELAEKYNSDLQKDVIISKVDCVKETSLCSDHDVTGYPTLKFFKAGETEGSKYRGTRDVASFDTFIQEQLGFSSQEEVKVPEIVKPVSGLVELTEETFANHVAKGKHFVKFYAPWCGFCQKLAPTWELLAKSLEYDTDVLISKVDCTLHRPVCNDFEVKGYPTLLWIEDGKKVEKYQGQRSLEDLKDFVKRMTEPDTPVPLTEQETTPESSPVASFSGDNFKQGISQGYTFVKFFAPWCGHCKRMAPTWEELGKKFSGNTHVKIVKVDCTQNLSKDLCNEEEVNGFPTIFLYKNGEKIEEYNGSRTLEDLYEFVTKHFQHDEL